MNTMTIPITVDLIDQFTSVLNSFKSQCESARKSVEQLSKSKPDSSSWISISSALKSMFGDVAGNIAKLNLTGQALGFLKQGFSLAIAESKEAEQAALGLADAMRMVGDTRMPQDVLDWNAKAADAWNISDEAISRAESTLMRVGHLNSAQAADLMKGAAGFKAQGKSIEEVSEAIGLGLAGNVRGLKQLGIQIEEGASKADIYDAVVQKMHDMEKATDDYAKSTDGKANGVKEAWRDAFQAFGDGFRGQFGIGEEAARNLQSTLGQLGVVFGQLGKGAGVLINVLVVGFHSVMMSLELLIGGAIASFDQAVGFIKGAWDPFKDYFAASMDVVAAAFSASWENIKLMFGTAINWIIDKASKLKEKFGADPIEWRVDTQKLSEELNKSEKAIVDSNKRALAASTAIAESYKKETKAAFDPLVDVVVARAAQIEAAQAALLGTAQGDKDPGKLDPAGKAAADAKMKAAQDLAAFNLETEKQIKTIRENAAQKEKEAMLAIADKYKTEADRIKAEFDSIRKALGQPTGDNAKRQKRYNDSADREEAKAADYDLKADRAEERGDPDQAQKYRDDAERARQQAKKHRDFADPRQKQIDDAEQKQNNQNKLNKHAASDVEAMIGGAEVDSEVDGYSKSRKSKSGSSDSGTSAKKMEAAAKKVDVAAEKIGSAVEKAGSTLSNVVAKIDGIVEHINSIDKKLEAIA